MQKINNNKTKKLESLYKQNKLTELIIETKKLLQIESSNIKQFEFKPNKLLEWFDSIFLTVCYLWPHKAPIVFMRLFRNADIKSIIRFMSDVPTFRDIISIILSMPKIIMIHGLIKKYVK